MAQGGGCNFCEILGIQELKLDPSQPKIEERISDPGACHAKTIARIKGNQEHLVKLTEESIDESDEGPAEKRQKNDSAKAPLTAKEEGGNQFVLGNGRVSRSIVEAAGFLMERDYPQIHDLTNDNYEPGKIGLVAVPQYFRSKNPEVVDNDEVKGNKSDCNLYRKKKKPKENEPKVSKLMNIEGAMKGEIAEKEVRKALVDYFEGKKEDVLLLHGHVFSEIDMQKVKKCPSQEKDFVIVNLSHGYIMSIEVKHQEIKGNKSSVDQVKETKELLERWFGADISSDWKFVGVSYAKSRDGSIKCCKNCEPFFLSSNDPESSSLAKIFGAMLNHVSTQLEGRPKPNPDEFRKLVKYLIFYSSSEPAPVPRTNVSHVEKSLEDASLPENIQFWMFPTPDQRMVMNEKRVLFTSSWSTGKTLLMKTKAEELAKKGEKVLFLVGNFNRIPLLRIELEMYFSPYNDTVTVKHFSIEFPSFKANLFEILEEYKKDHHIFVDELILRDYEDLRNFADQFPREKVLWITIAGYDSEADKSAVTDLFSQSFYSPKMLMALRNSQSITEEVLNEANGQSFVAYAFLSFHQEWSCRFTNLPESEKVKEIPCKWSNWKDALKEALSAMQNSNSKALIIVTYWDDFPSLLDEVVDFVAECENERPLMFSGKENEITEGLKKWMKSEAGHRKQHLVVENFVTNGYESQNVILLTGRMVASTNYMMRAMAHLIVIYVIFVDSEDEISSEDSEHETHS